MRPLRLARGTTLAAIALLLQAPACARRAQPETLEVAAASSLAEALEEIAAAWRNTPGGALVRANVAASNTLARQLEHGAPADVFLSADEAQMDRLEAAGLLLAGTRIDLLTNRLVIVTPPTSALRLEGPRDLLQPAVERLALGDPEAVPAGVYARRHLEALGLWRELAPRLVAAESVRGALAAVASGNADAAVVYRTDALGQPRVRIAAEIAAPGGPRIVYPAAVLRASRRPDLARRFLAYLRGPQAAAVFRRRGFGLLGSGD
jgi:molybdate transport system substrate-binding protein